MNNLPNPVSLETARDKFVKYLKDQKRSSATVIAYSNDIQQLRSYLESHRITQATTVQSQHLKEFVEFLFQKDFTPKTVSRKINSIKTFFKFLSNTGLNPSDPAQPLVHPKYTTASPRILTTSEYRALREACRFDIRICAIVELLLQTGMRISELANIHLEDIKKNELYIRPIENNPGRTIPLPRAATSAIQNYLAIRPKVGNDHLFVTKTGRPLLIRNIRTAIDRYFRQAGIKNAKVNDLRHTYIAHQLEAGTDPKVINEIVGHKRLTSTEKYLEFVKVPQEKISKPIEL